MSVRRRLEDAHILLANGRPDGALLSACTAISATSRIRYPDRTSMRDGEAFRKFLGEEMRVVFSGAVISCFVKCPGANLKKYPEEVMPLQDVLYEFVRCTLAHEGRIGKNVEFDGNEGITMEIRDDMLILSGELIRRLLVVPEFAPENVGEFPQNADMPMEVVGWSLFGARRDNHADYLTERQKRLVAITKPTHS